MKSYENLFIQKHRLLNTEKSYLSFISNYDKMFKTLYQFPKQIDINIIVKLNKMIEIVVYTRNEYKNALTQYNRDFRKWEVDTVTNIASNNKINHKYINYNGQKLVLGPNGTLFFATNSRFISNLIIGRNGSPVEIHCKNNIKIDSFGDRYDTFNIPLE
jgi:hypothetical protein